MRKQETRSVLIFGGAGFIGSNLAHSLLSHTEAKVHIDPAEGDRARSLAKFLVAMGALMVSGMVRLAESMVTQAHGVGG